MQTAAARHSKRLQERVEQCVLDNNTMNAGQPAFEGTLSRILNDKENVLAINSGQDGKSLRERMEREVNFTKAIHENYGKNPLFQKVLAHPEAHPHFSFRDGLIWSKNQLRHDVVCIPRESFLKGRRLMEVVIDHAHKTIGHFGQFKTSKYIRRFYWWPAMTRDIELFCNSCTPCQTAKESNQLPSGLLHTLPIPHWLWQSIGMDFVGSLPLSMGYNYLLVVIDQLMSMVHLIPTTIRMAAKEVAWLFLKDIVCLHGVPDSIVSNRDSKFTSKFWRELHCLMGTKLLILTVFHLRQMEQPNELIARLHKYYAL
jgi:hypothetical protein